MDDRNNNMDKLQLYSERITKIETQIQYVSVEQLQMKALIERLSAILEGIAKQIQNNELTAAAIRERTDQHNKIIEKLQESEVDIGKLLENMKTQLNIVKYFGAGFGTLVIGYFFTHFLK